MTDHTKADDGQQSTDSPGGYTIGDHLDGDERYAIVDGNNGRVHIEPDPNGDYNIGDLWFGGIPIGNMLDALNQFKQNQETVNQEVMDRLVALESEVAPDTGHKSFEEMTSAQKDRKLKIVLMRKAKKNGGKGSMDYNQVGSVFNGIPSDQTCYNIMRRIGRDNPETGFIYKDEGHGQKSLRVDLEKVTNDSLLQELVKEDDEN